MAFHDVVFARDFPERPFVVRARSIQLRNTGATLSPFNAFQLLQGLETLALRLERHEANARAIAAYLASDPRVEWVSFAGLRRQPLPRARPEIPEGTSAFDHHLRRGGRLRGGARLLRFGAAVQAPVQSGRREVARRSTPRRRLIVS